VTKYIMEGNFPPQQTQPTRPRVNTWVVARNAPIRLLENLHDLLDNYLKTLPNIDGEKEITKEYHMSSFQKFTYNLNIEHEYVYITVFVHYLKGDVRKWFSELPVNSTDSWEVLEVKFMRQWEEKGIACIIL